MSTEGGSKEPSLRPARAQDLDPETQQMDALRFSNRPSEPVAEQYPLPDTALHAAQGFYVSPQLAEANRHRYVLDAPFKLQSDDQRRYSLGNAASRILLAFSPKFSEARSEADTKFLDKAECIAFLKTNLGAVVQHAAKRAGQTITSEQFTFFRQNFLEKIDEPLIQEVIKATQKKYTENRKAEATALEDAAKNFAAGLPSDLPRPPSPDDLAIWQKSLIETLFEKLTLPDGKTLTSFIQDISGGKYTEVIPTGLWRDRAVENAISAADESVDVAAKRGAVESFLTNLPQLAASAIASRDNLTSEQKDRVLLAAEILYTRAAQLRKDRLQIIDRASVARETASLNDRCAQAFRTLYNYKVLPALRPPLEVEDRKPSERQTTYQARVAEAVKSQQSKRSRLSREFNEARGPILVDHLLSFMDRIEAGTDMRGIFPGTLGTILSSTGEDGRNLYKQIRSEIEGRPIEARFQSQQNPPPRIKDGRPYAVTDDSGRVWVPPRRMRESLDTSYRDIDNLRGNLEKELEKLKLVEFELMSPVDSDLITTAKRLDVLEADMDLRVARTVLVDARNAMTTGTDRGDPGSLKWRATADMAGKISGLEYLVRDASDRLLQVRKSLLLRLVSQARSQMISDPSADYGRLPALMTEYELVARGSRSSSDEVRAAISLFITE